MSEFAGNHGEPGAGGEDEEVIVPYYVMDQATNDRLRGLFERLVTPVGSQGAGATGVYEVATAEADKEVREALEADDGPVGVAVLQVPNNGADWGYCLWLEHRRRDGVIHHLEYMFNATERILSKYAVATLVEAEEARKQALETLQQELAQLRTTYHGTMARFHDSYRKMMLPGYLATVERRVADSFNQAETARLEHDYHLQASAATVMPTAEQVDEEEVLSSSGNEQQTHVSRVADVVLSQKAYDVACKKLMILLLEYSESMGRAEVHAFASAMLGVMRTIDEKEQRQLELKRASQQTKSAWQAKHNRTGDWPVEAARVEAILHGLKLL